MWFGHVRRKDDGHIGRRMPRMELPGKRQRRRPKGVVGAVREDMAVAEVTEEDAEDRTELRWKICCHDPSQKKPKEEALVLPLVSL